MDNAEELLEHARRVLGVLPVNGKQPVVVKISDPSRVYRQQDCRAITVNLIDNGRWDSRRQCFEAGRIGFKLTGARRA